ncbi:MAG: cbb3-type cytochrome c oxidase subunit I [Altibacter sp.]|nr:cbb3-type cytochrome c oxidase subunit I [Altibacter sp.]
MADKRSLYFLIFALSALLAGIIFGLTASLQYVYPELLKEYTPFTKLRPFHVTSVISWIVLAATGSIYFFLTQVENLKLFTPRLLGVHFFLFLLTGIGIYISYALGYMEGREYFAFAPVFVIPVLIGWVLFGINYFGTLRKKVRNWPVYYWMWGTGIVFMVYHISEAHLWLFDYFKIHFVKDMSVQWKSYGSFTGSWNMLVYGISIFVMSKIKKDSQLATSKIAFFFYFLGLTNLMFGWAHHTYFLPTQPWIRYVAYAVSMTEWVVLGSIIYNWRRSLPKVDRMNHPMATRFMMSADIWIFLNLILALLFSIPAINFFTHGTHVTVAHSMGTTIGINTTILLSALMFIIGKSNAAFTTQQWLIKRGLQLFNVSLFLFWCALLMAGIKKSYWMYGIRQGIFSEMQDGLTMVYGAISFFGLILVISLCMIVIPLCKGFVQTVRLGRT